MIIEVESTYRETGIICPMCQGEWMTYSDGQSAPQCSNPSCLFVIPNWYVYTWLITQPEFRYLLRINNGTRSKSDTCTPDTR